MVRKRSSKRVAVVTWPINDVGGINSWCKNFVYGLEQLCIPADVYYATAQTRFQCSSTKELVKARYTILRSQHLGYTAKALKQSIATLNDYDLLIMLHPSPHPTRAVKNKPDCRNWMELYRSTTPPKLVVFHDANWQKTNDWFSEVADHVDAIVAAQKLFYASVLDYPCDCSKRWEYFPLNLVMAEQLVRKSRNRLRGIVATQWLKWKNHEKFLPQLPDVRYPIHFYGSGQEYYTNRLNGNFAKYIKEDKYKGETYNPDSKHTFYGFVPYEQVMQAMANSRVSIDLSTKGYTNMTHWEPLTVATVSMMEERVANHPDNQIPEDCLIKFNLEDAAPTVNSAIRNTGRYKRVTDNGTKFIRKADCVAVARRVLRWLRRNGVVDLL